jgi:hypothetical protein
MYKYRINELLNSLPPSMSIEKFRANLKAKHNISTETFHVDRFLKLREHTNIPKDRLEVYAHEFKVPLHELFTKQEGTGRQR